MIDSKVQETIRAEYDRESGLYKDFAATVTSLIERMLQGGGVQLHSITQRCKSPKSLAAKLVKPEKEYTCLSDVTDIAAVRITTYFAEDVDRVAEVLEREFVIDIANSIDKRKLLDPDRFGYQSLHYVASITPERCHLVEYSRFSERKVEIQVRSILQHAWAEIEHDLGYKSAAGVPREIRRRFSRIAGLLELADDEFSAIRRELDAYAATMPGEIREQPQNVGINNISLRALISSEESSVRGLSLAVARIAGANLEPIKGSSLESSVANLKFLDISTVADLEQIALSHLGAVEGFARNWLKGERYHSLHEGIGILYLAYVLLAEQGDESRISNFIDFAQLGPNRDGLEERIINTYKATVTAR